MTDSYAVMGNPVAHSKSPSIHAHFAEQTRQDMAYRALLVEREQFSQAVRAFQDSNGRGFNVTVPFKQEAWALVDQRSDRAERAGAVNTVWFGEDGRRHGDNTDGIGLVRDLTQNHAISVGGTRVLVIGAGGAARGILGPLLNSAPKQLVICNRTAARAEELASLFPGAVASPLDGLSGTFDLVINATAASLEGQVPAVPEDIFAQGACAYDLMYADEPTAFLRWAVSHGAAAAVDGLGMLVEQAAESFFLWRGARPQTGPVIGRLRGLGTRKDLR